MTGRLIATLAALVAAGIALAPGVSAQEPPEPSVWTVTLDVDPDQVFSVAPEITGKVTHPPGTGTGTVTLTLSHSDPGPAPELLVRCPEPELLSTEIKAEPTAAEETAFSFEPVVACNGPYTVLVSGQPEPEVGEPATDSVDVKLAVPAPAPPPPDFTEVDDGVALTWDASRLPDLVGYRLQRDGAGGAEPKAWTFGPTVTSFRDRAAPGDYTYRLQVLRWGAGGPGSLTVVASPPSAASPTVTVSPGPRPPAGTTPPTGDPSPSRNPGGLPSPSPSPSTSPSPGPGLVPSRPSPPARPAPGPVTSLTLPGRRFPLPSPLRRPGTATTVDRGFQSTLPYDPEPGEEEAVEAEPLPKGRVVQRYDEAPRPGLVVPMAIALLLFSMAAHIRYLIHQAAQPAPATAVEGLAVSEPGPAPPVASAPAPAPVPGPTYDRWMEDLDAVDPALGRR